MRAGIEEHGDDFVVGVVATEPDEGAGAWLDTEDPALSDWYQPDEGGAEPPPDPSTQPSAPSSR